MLDDRVYRLFDADLLPPQADPAGDGIECALKPLLDDLEARAGLSDGGIVGEEREAKGLDAVGRLVPHVARVLEDGVDEVVDVDVEEMRTENAALRDAGADGVRRKHGLSHSHRERPLGQVALEPAAEVVGYVESAKLVEEARVPDLVEGLLEVDEDDAELLVLVDGRLTGLEETHDLVVGRALSGEATLELADKRTLPLVEPAKDDSLAQLRHGGE